MSAESESVQLPRLLGVPHSKVIGPAPSAQKGTPMSRRPSELAQSHLSRWKKMYPAVSTFGDTSNMNMFSNIKFMYISVFKADAALMGIFSALALAYSMVCGPFIGEWCDDGKFNFLCFSNVRVWGRRAPLGLMGIAVLVISGFLVFNGPLALDNSMSVAVWFLVVFLLIQTGFTMYRTASFSSRNEMFVSKGERVQVLSYCAAADGLAALVGFGILSPLTISDSEPLWQLYLGLGCVGLCFAFFRLPWVMMMTKTQLKTDCEKQPAAWRVLWNIVTTHPELRYQCLATHFLVAGSLVFANFFAFFGKYVLKLSNADVGTMQLAFAGGMAVTTIPAAWMAGKLVAGSDPIKVAVRSKAALGVAYFTCFFLSWFLVVQEGASKEAGSLICLAMYTLFGLCCGVVVPVVAVSENIINAWICDEDLVAQAEAAGIALGETDEWDQKRTVFPPRRDGVMLSTRDICGTAGDLWSSFFLVILGLLGYSGELDTFEDSNQPEMVVTFIHIIYIGFGVLCYFASAAFTSYLPYRGKHLQELTLKYRKLFSMEVLALEQYQPGAGSVEIEPAEMATTTARI